MTIKQLGGVFGRNPTFNDVTIEGELTFEGDIDVNSDLKVNGDLDVVGDITAGNQAFLKTVISDYSMEVGGQYGKMVGTKTGSGVGGLEFYSYSGGLYKTADLTNSGNLNLTTGNLIVSSGAGIDFSATGTGTGTSTSELFDDYEEGTFTPSLEDDAGNDYSGTYGYQEGSYTKIGNSVRFTLRIYADQSLTSNGLTGSEVLRIKSLPFVHADDNIGTGISINNGGNFNYDAGYTQALSLVAPNKSYIIFRQLGDSVTANNLTVTKCDSIGGITGFYAFVSGVYVV